MSKSDDATGCSEALDVRSPWWGTSREPLPNGRYLCEDGSGGWYLDPATGETDIAWAASTEWYGEDYRRRYVESRLRDGVPFSEWDPRGQREWEENVAEHGWALPT